MSHILLFNANKYTNLLLAFGYSINDWFSYSLHLSFMFIALLRGTYSTVLYVCLHTLVYIMFYVLDEKNRERIIRENIHSKISSPFSLHGTLEKCCLITCSSVFICNIQWHLIVVKSKCNGNTRCMSWVCCLLFCYKYEAATYVLLYC